MSAGEGLDDVMGCNCGGWRCGLLDGGGECEACAVVAVAVATSHGRERQLGWVAVHHDEDRVDRRSFLVLVFFVVCDVGAHDAGLAVAALEGFFEPVPAAFAAATPVVALNVEFCPVIEGDDAAVDAGDVATSEDLRVEAVVAVLVQRDLLGGHGWVLSIVVVRWWPGRCR